MRCAPLTISKCTHSMYHCGRTCYRSEIVFVHFPSHFWKQAILCVYSTTCPRHSKKFISQTSFICPWTCLLPILSFTCPQHPRTTPFPGHGHSFSIFLPQGRLFLFPPAFLLLAPALWLIQCMPPLPACISVLLPIRQCQVICWRLRQRPCAGPILLLICA